MIIYWIVSFFPYTYFFNISEAAQFPHSLDFAALSFTPLFSPVKTAGLGWIFGCFHVSLIRAPVLWFILHLHAMVYLQSQTYLVC